MTNEVWVGFVEVRQLPGEGHQITLSGKGAFTWIACWARDEASYRVRIEEVISEYGLFVAEVKGVMPLSKAKENGVMNEELVDICERTSENENHCISERFITTRMTIEVGRCGQVLL